MAKTAQEILDALDDAIYELTVNKVSSYKLGNREVTYHDLPELIRSRSYYQKQVNTGKESTNLAELYGE